MKNVRSIFKIFMIFLVMIAMGFMILYGYSQRSLRTSLIQTTTLQMKYSKTLLEQKIKEIEIEADGILNSDDLKMLCLAIEEGDLYEYVRNVNQMKDYLRQRQKSNVGMGQFVLYWPKDGRIIATVAIGNVNQELLRGAEDNLWIICDNEVYFIRQYITDWDEEDEDPYLMIQMDRDFLYNIKSIASGMEHGGSLLVHGKNESIFPTSDTEKALILGMDREEEQKEISEIAVRTEEYQALRSGEVSNGLELISYYPLKRIMEPVENLTRITGGLLLASLAIGLVFLILYYKNILLQLRILTEKLQQVENGDLDTRILEVPHNEFDYVFDQFNRMVTRINFLLKTTLKEQELRNRAELRQLQLQIHPHFLYNSLSYIVTVAEYPEMVRKMAVHLADYYRYCTKNKAIVTVGEEVAYAKAYLEIMAMRKNIEYSIEADSAVCGRKILPLLLQPIIENSIEHGIEARENAKHIYVKVYARMDGSMQFEVSDDGDGLSQEEIQELTIKIGEKQRSEGESVGLWNINQRLINYYDVSCGLKFGKSIWGGLMVSFQVSAEKGNDSKEKFLDNGSDA